MFSQTVEYALRAAVMLARNPGQPLAGREIARHTQVPSAYLSKVLAQLIKAGLAQGTRGTGGGYALTQPPHRIRVLDVVNAIEPLRRIHTCPLQAPGRCDQLCPLHCELDHAIAGVEQALARRTLADLIQHAHPDGDTAPTPTPTPTEIENT